MQVSGGIYNTSWFLVVNEGKWNAISDADRQAIMEVSGEAFAALAGRAWDAADKAGVDYVAKAGIEVHDTPPAVLEAIRTHAEKHEVAWADAVKADGYDGAAALAELRKLSGFAN
jgi:TRAP-type C4-dicarboxylate transport system substrate-binding protein